MPAPTIPSAVSKSPSTTIKAIRIFLLVLIVIGLGLIATYKFWVPKLVDSIIGSQVLVPSSVTVGSENIVAEGTFVASSTNPDFNTYTNNRLGFSMQIPKEASNSVGSCAYFTTNPYTGDADHSYRLVSTTTPLTVVTEGNKAYLDFSWMYDLTGSSSVQVPPYGGYLYYFSGCVKQDISEYLPIWIQYPNDPSKFSRTKPIQIYIKSATSTQAAETIVLNEFENFSGGGCSYSVQTSADVQQGVTDLSEQLPSTYQESTDGPDPCIGYSPTIKYSSQLNEVAIIVDGPNQYCPFGKTDGTCYMNQIASSFRFLQ